MSSLSAPDAFAVDYHRLVDLLTQVVKETAAEPSLIMFDGKPYKLIPEALADEIAAQLQEIPRAPVAS